MSVTSSPFLRLSLGVDDALLRPFLEGLSLEKAIEQQKIFIVDLGIVEGIPPAEGTQVGPAGCSLDLMPPVTGGYVDTFNFLRHADADYLEFPDLLYRSDPVQQFLLSAGFGLENQYI